MRASIRPPQPQRRRPRPLAPHTQRLIELWNAGASPDQIVAACGYSTKVVMFATVQNLRQRGYDLVLAGHLHGCQIVAFEYQDRLFPGALFYPYCYLSHQQGATRLIVSRGVSDLVPIRWRCPREVVVCYV